MQVTGAELAAPPGKESLAEAWSEALSEDFLLPESERGVLTELLRTDYPKEMETLKEMPQKALAQEFDLLGSESKSLGPEIDWHRDFKSGRRIDQQEIKRFHFAHALWSLRDDGRPSKVRFISHEEIETV